MKTAPVTSLLFPGPAWWDRTWETTPGWPTRGPLQTCPTARSLSTAALANWTRTDITTVRVYWLWKAGGKTDLWLFVISLFLFSSRYLPEPARETQRSVQRQSHLQHHQRSRRGRPAGILRHLLQCILQTGSRPVQQQPGAVKRWTCGAAAGPGPVDHPVWSVWVWICQAPVHQEEQRWGFPASVINFSLITRNKCNYVPPDPIHCVYVWLHSLCNSNCNPVMQH